MTTDDAVWGVGAVLTFAAGIGQIFTNNVTLVRVCVIAAIVGSGLVSQAWSIRLRRRVLEVGDDAIEEAYGIIANAHNGNWDKATPEWRAAAEWWRDPRSSVRSSLVFVRPLLSLYVRTRRVVFR